MTMQYATSARDLIQTPSTGDQLVHLYPSCGRLSPGGDYWQLAVRGRVVKPRPDNLRKKMLMRLLRRALKVPASEFESTIFRDRVADFLMLGLRDRNISIQIGDRLYPLKKASKKSGYFDSSIRVPTAETISGAEVAAIGSFPALDFFPGNERQHSYPGSAQLIPPVGPTVISDIDDTLKVTDVADNDALLTNTFLKPFRQIEGMTAQYQTWAMRGTAFHYVSASPWPLFRPLRNFLAQHGFPAGSFHLRTINIQGAGPLRMLVGGKRGKRKSVRNILRWYPHRKFVLIGDSGERDLEIYGWAARRFPDQIEQICIRRVTSLKRKRLKRAFRKIPCWKWRIFEAAEELADLSAIAHVGWDWNGSPRR